MSTYFMANVMSRKIEWT